MRRILPGLAALTLAAGCGSSSPSATTARHPAARPAPTATTPALIVHQKDSVAAFVPVTVHGHRYFFQVDSGAAQTIIDSGVAKQLGLTAAGAAETKTTIACKTPSHPVTVSNWKLGGVALPAVKASATKTELPAKTKGKVIGLLGSDVFDRFGRLTLDYRGKSITLGGPAPSGGRSVPVRVAHSQGETFILAVAAVRGSSTGFLIDTGAGNSTIDVRAARKLGLKPAGRARTVTAVSCPARVQPVRIDDWRIGQVKLPATDAVSSKSDITDQTKGKVVGLIGSDVLSRYGRVSIDFKGQRLLLGG